MASSATPAHARPAIPPHVPPDLVRDLDIFAIDVGDDPQAAIIRDLSAAPPIFYMPRSLRFPDWGSWVFKRGHDIRAIMQDTEHFSNHGVAGFDQLSGTGDTWLALPAEADPPDHGKYRALLNPLFSPARIKAYEANIRAHVIEVIESAAEAGSVDFVLLARKLPAGIFSQLLGLTVDETLGVIDQVKLVLHSGYDVEKRRAGVRGIMAIEKDLVEKRRKQRGHDLVSIALDATIDGRPLTEKEMLGMFFFFLLAGLDTIAGATGFMFRYLAEHSEVRRKLASDPTLIPDAIEDSLRRHSQITTNRFVKEDVEIGGVALKAGDHVFCSLVLANLDPQSVDRPLEVDIARNPNLHVAFGAGPHRCIGSNIARLQMRVTLEEWLKRLPEFWIPAGGEIRAVNSEALVLSTLPLAWADRGSCPATFG